MKIYRKTCDWCGMYYVGRGTTYCSQSCVNSATHTGKSTSLKGRKLPERCGENNHMYKPKVKMVCLQCGSNYDVVPSKVIISKCCSRECDNLRRTNNRIGVVGYWKDKHFSDEHCDKIRDYHIGTQMSQESKDKNRLAHLGKHPSEETRKKLSLRQLGEKNHAYGKPSKLKGIPRSEEVIQKVIAAGGYLKSIEKLRSKKPYFYDNLPFDSNSEKEAYRYLREKLGLSKDEIKTHVKVGRKEADFLINDNVFLEYHPCEYLLDKRSKDEYYTNRRNNLDINGYQDNPLVVVESLKELKNIGDNIAYMAQGECC